MSLYRALLRHDRAMILGWGLGLLVYMFIIGASYASIKDNPEYDQLWEELPDSLKEAFGGAGSITTVDGYLESQATSLYPVLLGLVAVLGATKRTCGAEERGALDHVLARPVTRVRYAFHVMLSQATLQLAILAASVLGALGGFLAADVKGFDLVRVAAAFGDLLPYAVLSIGLGMVLGTAFHRRGPALGVGVGIIIGSFALNVVANIDKSLEWMEWLTPIAYWARSDLFHGEPDPTYYVVFFVLGSLLILFSLRRFDAKDLHA